MAKPALRLGVVVLGFVLAQVAVFSQLPVAGARPIVLLVLPVAAGLALGSDRGAIVGFAGGLAFDLLLTTPLGLGALVFTGLGALAGRYARLVRGDGWWRWPVTTGAFAALGCLALSMAGTVLGQRGFWTNRMVALVVAVAVTNALVAPLARGALRWAWDEPTGPALFGVSHGR